MRKVVDVVLTGIMVLCALVVVGLAVEGRLGSASAQPERRPQIDTWRELAAQGRLLGPAEAQVKIVEFADYECIFCAKANSLLQAAQRKYSGQVAVVYRHLPLDDIHPNASMLAVAAECAGEQGRFAEFHEEAYRDLLSRRAAGPPARPASAASGGVLVRTIAQKAGIVDVEEFGRCMATQGPMDAVQRDLAVAQALGFRGTPVLIVNGEVIIGMPSQAELDGAIERALSGAS